MSGREMAGAKGPPEDVIDVDVPLLVPYVSTYGQRVFKLVETFKIKFLGVNVNAGTKLQSVLYNGKRLEGPYAQAAARRVYEFNKSECLREQISVLYNIAKVYQQPEQKDEFADASKDVYDLLTILEANTPVQRVVKQIEERDAAAEVAKAAAKAAKACEAAQLGEGMSSGGGAARDSGKKRKDR